MSIIATKDGEDEEEEEEEEYQERSASQERSEDPNVSNISLLLNPMDISLVVRPRSFNMRFHLVNRCQDPFIIRLHPFKGSSGGLNMGVWAESSRVATIPCSIFI